MNKKWTKGEEKMLYIGIIFGMLIVIFSIMGSKVLVSPLANIIDKDKVPLEYYKASPFSVKKEVIPFETNVSCPDGLLCRILTNFNNNMNKKFNRIDENWKLLELREYIAGTWNRNWTVTEKSAYLEWYLEGNDWHVIFLTNGYYDIEGNGYIIDSSMIAVEYSLDKWVLINPEELKVDKQRVCITEDIDENIEVYNSLGRQEDIYGVIEDNYDKFNWWDKQ